MPSASQPAGEADPTLGKSTYSQGRGPPPRQDNWQHPKPEGRQLCPARRVRTGWAAAPSMEREVREGSTAEAEDREGSCAQRGG